MKEKSLIFEFVSSLSRVSKLSNCLQTYSAYSAYLANNMKILAVDYGSKRIGLAWSDTTLGVVLPYGVVKNMAELVKLIKSEATDKVVVGFPVSANGKENNNTNKVKDFVFNLQKQISVPIEIFDERYSSQAADAMGGGVTRDEKSAMVILEGYIQKNNKSINQ